MQLWKGSLIFVQGKKGVVNDNFSKKRGRSQVKLCIAKLICAIYIIMPIAQANSQAIGGPG